MLHYAIFGANICFAPPTLQGHRRNISTGQPFIWLRHGRGWHTLHYAAGGATVDLGGENAPTTLYVENSMDPKSNRMLHRVNSRQTRL